jgi:hypothetical protein
LQTALIYMRLPRRRKDGTIRPIRRFVGAGGGAHLKGSRNWDLSSAHLGRQGTTLAYSSGPGDQRFEGE